jgi:hypothetical protein
MLIKSSVLNFIKRNFLMNNTKQDKRKSKKAFSWNTGSLKVQQMTKAQTNQKLTLVMKISKHLGRINNYLRESTHKTLLVLVHRRKAGIVHCI